MVVLKQFWANFDLNFGLLAKNGLDCSAPALVSRLGAAFPGARFGSRTPVWQRLMG